MFLSYCTNIHPAETWSETFAALCGPTTSVARKLRRSQGDPFPVGLRLSALAASELLEDRSRIRSLRSWMEEENMLAYTINGFPYGKFHGGRVKENVFAPDWSTPERVAYTHQLFQILTELLPEGSEGSASTVPGSFSEFVRAEPERKSAILSALRKFALDLDQLADATRIDFHLGLEPEPLGLIDNTDNTLDFFSELSESASSDERGAILRRLGICYDTCHFAIAGDQAAIALGKFAAADIRLSKVHFSNALTADPRSPGALDHVAAFAEPVYLHQVVADMGEPPPLRFTDLPDALDHPEAAAARQWRIHFHIPLYASPEAPLGSTSAHLLETAHWLGKHPGHCRHFEIETYTYNVLPEHLRPGSVEELIISEFQWCHEHLLPIITPGA